MKPIPGWVFYFPKDFHDTTFSQYPRLVDRWFAAPARAGQRIQGQQAG
jgi:hypothetical protein